jgi:hypothetical protein
LKVILHIGCRKTGTTAIQYLLYTNRALLRERHRINYPERGLMKMRAHHAAAWALLGRDDPQRPGLAPGAGAFADMLRETEERGCGTMLVSSEVLSQGDPAAPARIAGAFAPHEVEIIAYARRQDRYIEARHNQRIKSGRTKMRLGEFVDDHLARNALDYHDYFRRWAAAVGRERLKVRVYERDAFRQRDVRRDFLDAAGIPEDGLAFEEGTRNTSLGFGAIQLLERLGAVDLEQPGRRRLTRLLERYGEKTGDHTSLLAPAERRAILEHYRESNRRFAREFLGVDTVFEMPAAEEAREAQLDRSFGEERFLDMLSFILPRLLSPAAGGKNGPRKKRKKDGARRKSQASGPKSQDS